jgi:hypothetical protein
MVVSLLRVVRHSYHPHSGVLIRNEKRNLADSSRAPGHSDGTGIGDLSFWGFTVLCECQQIFG